MGDRINPEDADPAIPAPQPQPQVPSRTRASRAADFLQDSCRIVTLRQHYEKYRRYVYLKRQELFTALVDLYQSMFSSRQRDFRGLHDAFPAPQGTGFYAYAARAYISMWFYDLYVSNREAARAISPIAFTQFYEHEVAQRSHEYDDFMCYLHAAIHPTHIKGISEDVMYIPIINNETNWNIPDNPFNITGFEDNFDLAQGVLMRMRDSRAWNISSLVTTTTGRPTWLFDWHDTEMCLAWFPLEGNYTMEDVTIAYIIGEACTPNLAYRDVDDWQNFTGNVIPQNFTTNSLNRVVGRRFYGSYEVRSHEVRMQEIAVGDFTGPADAQAQKKRKTPDASGSGTHQRVTIASGAEPTPQQAQPQDAMDITLRINQFRIVDWIYYTRHVAYREIHTRIGALKVIVIAS
nr:coat protein [Polygonatum partitivirus 2]